MSSLNGVLLIDKPKEFTSFDVIAVVRRLTGQKKLGHTGTLDPNATGVLPVLLGTATKTQDLILNHDKSYTAEFQLGKTTDTLDIWGTVTGECESSVTEKQLRRVIPNFTGEIEQIPPMYSAIKIGGKKLYELARRGEEVERKPRPVTIYELEVVEQTAPDAFTLRIRCSKGTYVRTLCHDIGRALGCGGCMSALRRTMAAGFTLADAVTLERVQLEGESLLQPVDSLFRAHPAYHIRTERAEALCRNGNPLAPPDAPADGLYRVYGRDGTFLCLSRAQNGTLTSLKNFFGA